MMNAHRLAAFTLLFLVGCQLTPIPDLAKRKPVPRKHWALTWQYTFEEPNTSEFIAFRVYHRTNLMTGSWTLLGITNGFSWLINTNLPADFFRVTATNTYGKGES